MDYTTYKAGKLRGDKIRYKDGVGCTIWTPFKDNDDNEETPGLCFDFPSEELENLKNLTEQLIAAKPDDFVEDPEDVKREEEWKQKTSTWHYKLLDALSDLTLTISPFEWRLSTLWVAKPTKHGKQLAHQICKGFMFGPFTVTWW